MEYRYLSFVGARRSDGGYITWYIDVMLLHLRIGRLHGASLCVWHKGIVFFNRTWKHNFIHNRNCFYVTRIDSNKFANDYNIFHVRYINYFLID